MTRSRSVTILVAIILVLGVAGLVFWRLSQGALEEAEPDPVAQITVATAHSLSVGDVIGLYGDVQADPTAAFSIAAPRAVIVSRILVRPGQAVAAGQALMQVTSAPASDLSFKQAADALTFAQTELVRVQRLYDERLAATDQLAAAKKALADAQTTYAAAQKQGGGGGAQTLTAPRAGVVATVPVASGDHIAEDAPLITLAAAGGAVARLTLEPSERRVAVGQAVRLSLASGAGALSSRIAMIGKTADPATKTLDVIVPLNGSPWPIGAVVQAQVSSGAHGGVVIPRAAVVFDETGPHVFIVSGEKAQRVFITVGLDQGDNVEVTKGLAAGAVVAVEGAYELQDGMAVKVRAP